MKILRSMIVAAVLLAGLASTGWGQQQQFAQVPVRGSYSDGSAGRSVTFEGDLRVMWMKEGVLVFLRADARCPDCGGLFTLYGMSREPVPEGLAGSELVDSIRSLNMIGLNHAHHSSGPATVELAMTGAAVR